jgi:hypothetical protein
MKPLPPPTASGPLIEAYRKAAGCERGRLLANEQALEAVVTSTIARRLGQPDFITMIWPSGGGANWVSCQIDRIRPDGSIILKSAMDVSSFEKALSEAEDAAGELSSAIGILEEAVSVGGAKVSPSALRDMVESVRAEFDDLVSSLDPS